MQMLGDDESRVQRRKLNLKSGSKRLPCKQAAQLGSVFGYSGPADSHTLQRRGNKACPAGPEPIFDLCLGKYNYRDAQARLRRRRGRRGRCLDSDGGMLKLICRSQK